MSFKRICGEVHLWAGLVAGVVMFISCITGSIYVFRPDIERLFESYEFVISDEIVENNERPSFDTIQTRIKSKLGKKIVYFKRYEDTHKPDVIGVQEKKMRKDRKTGKEKLQQVTTRYYFNSYTTEILGKKERVWNNFFRFIIRLHMNLTKRPVGRTIIGISTIIFTFMLITGIVLWFPKKYKQWKNWKKRLTIKTNKGFKKLNFDLHNTLGFYSLIFLLMMCLTGLYWSFEWYYYGYQYVLTGKTKTEIKSEEANAYAKVKTNKQYAIKNNATKLPLSFFVKRLHKEYPHKGDWTVSRRTRKGHPYVLVSKTGGYNWINYTNRLYLDPYKGEVLREETLKGKSIGEQISMLTYNLHVGGVFGGFTRILYFLVCIIGSSLPITGTIHWFKKKKKKNRFAKKRVKREHTLKKG